MNDIRQPQPNRDARSRTGDIHGLPAGATGRPASDSVPQIAVGDVHASAAEIVELTARLGALPATRADVVQVVAERLATGYYLTRSAALKAAQNLVAR
jgi:hypothetical protein